MLANILDQPVKDGYQTFLKICSVAGADTEAVEKEAEETLRLLTAKRARGSGSISPRPLERRWYQSLESGKPDYSVYLGDDYVGDTWTSWAYYSRKYLRLVRKSGFLDRIPAESKILDIGCGIGMTTAALTQMVPEAVVTGTNMYPSRQFDICQVLGSIFGFSVVGGLDEVGDVDLVFASEYFEHIQDPIDHLKEVLSHNPSYLIVASTYNRPSIGHFDTTGYRVDGEFVSNTSVSTAFTKVLRENGFEKTEYRLWNGRPQCWSKRLVTAKC